MVAKWSVSGAAQGRLLRSRLMLSGLCLSLAGLASCGRAPQASASRPFEVWNQENDPKWFAEDFSYDFNRLPLEGRVIGEHQPWTGSVWPSNAGGVSQRWNHPVPQNFVYTSPTADEAKAMSQQELARLSPAEKFDLFMGRYEYPTVAAERKRTAASNPGWWGLCHGWSASSILFAEPLPKTVRNPDGILIPFGSSDLKALLAYYFGVEKLSKLTYKYIGVSCKTPIDRNPREGRPQAVEGDADCKDVNAGAFHVALANRVGLRNLSFVIDASRTDTIWNQPVVSFRSEITGQAGPQAHSAPGTSRVLRVKTTLELVSELGPRWSALNGTTSYKTDLINYEYTLDINAQNKIIGGDWTTWNRPDFAWLPEFTYFEGYWTELGDLVSR